jgi:hypothetical protein
LVNLRQQRRCQVLSVACQAFCEHFKQIHRTAAIAPAVCLIKRVFKLLHTRSNTTALGRGQRLLRLTGLLLLRRRLRLLRLLRRWLIWLL